VYSLGTSVTLPFFGLRLLVPLLQELQGGELVESLVRS